MAGRMFDTFQPNILDLSDLLADRSTAFHIATKFG
jgi:hypothetical protein